MSKIIYIYIYNFFFIYIKEILKFLFSYVNLIKKKKKKIIKFLFKYLNLIKKKKKKKNNNLIFLLF